MLLIGSKVIRASIMGLQTGTRLAVTKEPIIDPATLKIIAYEVDGPLLTEHPSFLRIADIRELSPIGMIIDSNDEFVGHDDVIEISKLLELGFKLIGVNVIDDTGKKLGKVVDYIIDTDSFFVQQLKVKQKMMKSLTNTELLINRTQIVEISNTTITVKSTRKKIKQTAKSEGLSFVNPFKPVSPQTNTQKNLKTTNRLP